MLNMIKWICTGWSGQKYVCMVWIVMAAAIFLLHSMSKLDIDTMNKGSGTTADRKHCRNSETRNHQYGNVRIPADTAGRKVTVFDQVYANLQAKFVALFLVIFYSAVFQCRYRKRLY